MTQDWLQITLPAHSEAELEHIEAALQNAGSIALTYQAADEEEIYEPPIGSMPLWAQTHVTGLFPRDSQPEQVLTILHEQLGDKYPIKQQLLADADWVRAWLDHFKPIPFGNGFWVAASEHHIDEPNATILRLDPGLAFGTGTHPSTAMCLDYLNQHRPTAKTVYDYGCGSGILGIAAALLGAKHVWMTDIDPQALTATEDNAQKNQTQQHITICPNPDTAPIVDLLIANILLKPLCNLKTQFMRHTDAHATLIFAGVLAEQADTLIAHYQDTHHIRIINEREGWVLLEGKPH